MVSRDTPRIGTWTLDIPSMTLTCSAACKANYGREPGDLLTYLELVDTIHEDDRARWRTTVEANLRNPDGFDVEYRVRWRDGSLHDVQIRATHLPERPDTVMGISVDVTTQRRADEALRDAVLRNRELVGREIEHEARYRILFETTDDGFAIIERIVRPSDGAVDFRHVELNPAFELQSGIHGALGRTIREIAGELDGDEWVEIFERVASTGESVRFDREIQVTGRMIEVNAFRVPGLVEGRVAVAFKNVTPRRAAEARLRESEASLSIANRAKDEFLAILGHELRNPLAPIMTALHLIEQRTPTVAVKERAVIERQVAHLRRLVDDLLDVSRITTGKVHLERHVVAVDELVAQAVEIAAPLIEERQHRVSVFVGEGLAVLGDPVRLGQALGNLITNAAKYTGVGGAIVVVASRDGDEAVIDVRDNGMGMSAEVLPRVFEMFVQERQSIDRGLGGLGLGLAIVKTLVELHGGTVSAHSAGLAQGSRFQIRVPATTPRRPRSEPPTLPPPVIRINPLASARPRKVLIVDDNTDAAELLSDALRLRGNDTRIAHDGPSALDALASFMPEVAVLDIGLPVMDGYELARHVRSVPALSGCRLVALTGYGQASDFAKTRAAGFDAHLVKPLDIADLDLVFEDRK